MSGGWSRLERGPDNGKHIWGAVKFAVVVGLVVIVAAVLIGGVD